MTPQREARGRALRAARRWRALPHLHRAIDAALRRASSGVYRLRLIHGYHGGTALRDLCREYAGHPRVLRLVASPGSTDLVLREF